MIHHIWRPPTRHTSAWIWAVIAPYVDAYDPDLRRYVNLGCAWDGRYFADSAVRNARFFSLAVTEYCPLLPDHL
jgi:hypothetical protein